MKLKHLFLIPLAFAAITVSAQTKKKKPAVNVIQASSSAASNTLPRPKLVVGIVVDQMRWDYLYRYADLYGNDGFKRLLREGFSCQNTMISYVPTYTAPGHSCIYTGSVPAINGIAGNNWIDNNTGQSVYCVDDKLVHIV